MEARLSLFELLFLKNLPPYTERDSISRPITLHAETMATRPSINQIIKKQILAQFLTLNRFSCDHFWLYLTLLGALIFQTVSSYKSKS
jgi:hypothetical protein